MSNLLDQVMRSLQTIREMLTDRGVEHRLLQGLSVDEVQALIQETPIILLDVSATMKVLYCLFPSFKIAKVRDVLQNMEGGVEDMIIITKENLTSTHLKSLHEELPHTRIQCFTLKELQVNISKHILVPKHELITDTQAIQDILASYHVKTRAQLPLILKTDPMAKYLNAQPGNLVRVTRVSPSAGEYVCYRCCV